MNATIEKIEAGEMVDFDLSNGAIRSSKQIYQATNGKFYIFHNIDGSTVEFTRSGIIEVLKGERSPWDGDAQEEVKNAKV